MKIIPVLLLCLCLCVCTAGFCEAPPAGETPLPEEIIAPVFPVPDYVEKLLSVASGEVGYAEGEHGWSKYGEWAGDPYAQWCAEFLCWCVDQTDQLYGTDLLNNVYPKYSGSNTGRNWFIRAGRYIVRWGNLEEWGYQWLNGEDHFLTTGDYIPQPGDWVFFTWDSDQDTDHVAMVEYCTVDTAGQVHIHVIEGNKPVAVERFSYPLDYNRILGYGTVHDAAGYTMRYGNVGEKVRQMQEKLHYLGLLPAEKVTGTFGSMTLDAIRLLQQRHGLKTTGIANLKTQALLDELVSEANKTDPDIWTVVDDDE